MSRASRRRSPRPPPLLLVGGSRCSRLPAGAAVRARHHASRRRSCCRCLRPCWSWWACCPCARWAARLPLVTAVGTRRCAVALRLAAAACRSPTSPRSSLAGALGIWLARRARALELVVIVGWPSRRRVDIVSVFASGPPRRCSARRPVGGRLLRGGLRPDGLHRARGLLRAGHERRHLLRPLPGGGDGASGCACG